MTGILYENMNIPKTCEVGSALFKKLFYDNASMNTRDKDIFTSDINKIIWKYSFKEDTINIQPYRDEEREYEEVALIEVELYNNSRYKRIAEIIQRTIPYPLILVFFYDSKFLINVTHKRINIRDESKNTVEEFIFTEWIDVENLELREKQFLSSIDIMKFSFSSYFRFYSDIVDKINIFNASRYHNDFNALSNKDVDEAKRFCGEIEELEKGISDLRSKIINERYINRRIELNVEIKRLETKMNSLLKQLNTE